MQSHNWRQLLVKILLERLLPRHWGKRLESDNGDESGGSAFRSKGALAWVVGSDGGKTIGGKVAVVCI